MSEGAALVVGGTGMLKAVSLSLARERTVAVVARGAERLEALRAREPRIVPVPVDWRSTGDLEKALRAVTEEHGAFTLCVAWVRGDAPEAALAAARFVRGRFFLVLGSEAADPDRRDPGRRERFEALPGLSYHEVVLGFVRGPGGSRWLTHAEIVRGVLTAVAWARPRTTVGVVEPRSARPGTAPGRVPSRP